MAVVHSNPHVQIQLYMWRLPTYVTFFRFLGIDPPTMRTCIWTSPEARKDDCNLFDRSLVTLVAMSFSSESESSS